MKHKLYVSVAALLAAMLLIGCAQRNDADLAASTPTETPLIEQSETEPHVGMVRGKVLLDNGEMVPAGIIVEDSEGNRYRTTTNSFGGYNLRLLPGDYTLYFTKGSEYSVIVKTATIESYKVVYLQDVRLVQLFDSYALGWIAGDLHQHTFYSDGADSVEQQLVSNASANLYYGFLSDHNSARGLAEWMQGDRVVVNVESDGALRNFHPFEAVEVTTEFGHYQSLGVGLTFDTYEVQLHDIERSKTGDEKDNIIMDRIIYIAQSIQREGGLAQINHPYSANTMGFNYWQVAEYFDTVEIWNGINVPGDGRYEPEKASEQSVNYRGKLRWFELLNEVKNGGKYLPATGGTDNHNTEAAKPYPGDGFSVTDKQSYATDYAYSGLYSGVPTTYVYCPGEITQEKVLEAIKLGNSFISNGIVLLGSVGDAIYGETVTLGESAPVLDVTVFCRDGLEGFRIVKNGEIWRDISLDGVSDYQETLVLDGLEKGDWIVLEALGTGVLYAISNPFFFE